MLHSPLKVVDIFHLQNNVKLTPEIDAQFLVFEESGAVKKALVTFEAKRAMVRFHADNMVAAVRWVVEEYLLSVGLCPVEPLRA